MGTIPLPLRRWDSAHTGKLPLRLDNTLTFLPAPAVSDTAQEVDASAVVARPKPARLVSLDAFRGMTILGMLLVNNVALGEHTPTQLLHADWSPEVHLADLVFPWFLFIVGVAVPYSAASARRKHLPSWQFDLKALYRAIMLVFLGCLIDSSLAKHVVIDLGVLQVIGLAYFVAVLVGGLLNLPSRLLLATGLLVINWATIRFAAVPGMPAGHFGENDNVIDAINRLYLTPYHLNGLLSVIPTTAMVLIGTAAGDLIRRKKIRTMAKLAVLEICGAGLIAAGSLWSYDLPMNKPLWTAPYILYTAGWACVGLGITYLLVDTTPSRWASRFSFPLLVFGTNAILAYVTPILTKALILHNIALTGPGSKAIDAEQALQYWCYGHLGRISGGWTYTAGYIVFWWLVLLFFYRKRWFLRV
jgi:predicted acyltransferase